MGRSIAVRALLDTHAFLWWMADSDRLSGPAHRAIADEANDIVVSAASAWEIATKYRLGRLPGVEALARNVPRAITSQGFTELSITMADAVRPGGLTMPLTRVVPVVLAPATGPC